MRYEPNLGAPKQLSERGNVLVGRIRVKYNLFISLIESNLDSYVKADCRGYLFIFFIIVFFFFVDLWMGVGGGGGHLTGAGSRSQRGLESPSAEVGR